MKKADERDVIIIFFDEQQLRELYTKAGFQNVSIDRYMYTENDGSKRNAWWHVVAQK